MKFETLELNLSDDEQLRLICSVFDISDALCDDIKNSCDDHDERIVKLVLSEAVSRVLTDAMESETTEND